MEYDTSRKIGNLISGVVLLLLVAAEGLLLYRIYSLMMIPDTYLLILQGAMVLLTGLIWLLSFRKADSKPRPVCRILGYLLAAAVLGLCGYGQYALGQVQGTISAVTGPENVNVVLEVYIRAEDSPQTLAAGEDCILAVPEGLDQTVVSGTQEELEALLGRSITVKIYPHIVAQADALLAGDVHAIVLDTAYLTILETMADYADFEDKVRLLHEQIIQKETPEAAPSQSQEPPRELDVTRDGFLVYVSGSDSRRTMLTTGRSDVNILVAVNPTTGQILLINTPRDYYVVNPASGNDSMDKLTHCGVQGVENSIGALERLYGQQVDYYARINFSGLRTLIDAIGGVTIYSDKSFSAGYTYIQKGENHLNGAQALDFARERKNLWGGDNDRGKNQMKLITGIINQLSAENLLNNYTDILKSLEGMFATDMPAEKIGELVQLQLSRMPQWEVFSFAVTGDNGTDHCWAAGGYAYVMYPHAHMVEHASGLIEAVLEGETLTSEDLTVNP